MNTIIDLEREYGIVLEGGGAKGAYQIGVWKALLEYDVRIKAISGASVGALNGALICMGDYERAASLWENITYSQVMNVDDDKMDKFIKGVFREFSFKELTKDTIKFFLDKGIDIEPLRNMIHDYVDEEKIRSSPIQLIINTLSISTRKEIALDVKEIESGLIEDYLLGSAYFPAFKMEKLHGEKYMDGGIVNNIPIDHLIHRGYKDIIVIRIFGIGLAKNIKIPEDVNVIEIAPRVNLGSLLEFDAKKSKRNIEIGYLDGIRCLKGLDGKTFYIDCTHTEEYYFRLLSSVEKKYLDKIFEFFAIEPVEEKSFYRQLFEEFYPFLAIELKMGEDWSYKELFLMLAEKSGIVLRIKRFQIYTEKEFLEGIQKKYQQIVERGVEYSPFIHGILKLITYLSTLIVDKN